MKKLLLSLSRSKKQIVVASTDFCIIIFSFFASAYISQEQYNTFQNYYFYAFLVSSLCISIFFLTGVYKSVLRFIDLTLIYLVLNSILISVFSITFFISIFLYSGLVRGLPTANLGILILLISSTFIILVRLIANRLLSDGSSLKKVIIYGAGSAGMQLAGALRIVSSEMRPIAFVDRDTSLHGTFLGGMKVLHPKKLEKLVRRNEVDEVLIAMPSASRSTLRELLKEIEGYSVKVRILPGLADLAQGKVLVSELKEVDITDLLGRYEVEANQELLDRNIKGKTVLITGAGGSIGSEITRQVARNSPKTLIILDANEYALYEIMNEIESSLPDTNLKSIIASVANKKRMKEVCQNFSVDTIYHSAAYKHVPLVEQNPFEGVFNNIIGTKTCVESAIESKVKTFVLISTDKAVRPTNIMGATKRFAEMILQSYSDDKNIDNVTRMSMVRFGNVLGSSGSAIPLFQQQIKNGGPVTVTHPEVIRYFMSIPEAAELVIQAGAMGKGGDVFVLDMGEPVRISDLAKRLINLSGYEVKDENHPDGDIEIVFTGLRSGEKLYEELLIGENISKTDHQQILRAEEEFIVKEEIEKLIDELKEAEKNNDVSALKEIFRQVIHGYEPEENIVDVISLQKTETQ